MSEVRPLPDRLSREDALSAAEYSGKNLSQLGEPAFNCEMSLSIPFDTEAAVGTISIDDVATNPENWRGSSSSVGENDLSPKDFSVLPARSISRRLICEFYRRARFHHSFLPNCKIFPFSPIVKNRFCPRGVAKLLSKYGADKKRPAVGIQGLTPGMVYAFEVRALGKLGYTDSATCMCT